MCDLEDKILKKNIPGKYTWWEKDSDEEGSLHDSDEEPGSGEPKQTDMQKVQKWEEQEIPKPLQMAALNNLRNGQSGAANTGPKGVLQDYKVAKKQMELDYEVEQQMKELLIEAMANGVSLLPGQEVRKRDGERERDRDRGERRAGILRERVIIVGPASSCPLVRAA